METSAIGPIRCSMEEVANAANQLPGLAHHDEGALLRLRPATEPLGTRREAEFQRHVESRENRTPSVTRDKSWIVVSNDWIMRRSLLSEMPTESHASRLQRGE